MRAETAEIDPITFEVLQHRLWMLNDEQAKVAIRISGSMAVYDLNDFSASLLTPEGESLFVGAQVTRLANALHIINQNIIRLFRESGSINEGDMFITNDPWIGAAHHNDFAIMSPVFWEGEIICWTGIAMHEMDVGGPSSLSTRAKDAFGEPPLFPPLKLVEGGVFRTDVERLLLRNTRTPGLNGLDLRARIAAQNVVREQIHNIVRGYGKDTFLLVQRRIKESVAVALRRRLRELPDGVWREEGFIDHNGFENRLFRLVLTMTKKDDKLILDFRGTDKQTLGTVNCAPPGLYGGIFSALLPMLCFDLTWCPAALHGVIEVIAENGTLNNADFPAAVGVATVSTMWATGQLVRSCLSKAYAASEKYRDEVQAGWAPGHPILHMSGFHKNDPTVLRVGFAGLGITGGGARGWGDGLDSSGPPGSPGMSIPNAEAIEKGGMLLVLSSRQRPDTVGRGFFRGGVAAETVTVPYECVAPLEMIGYSQGHHHPESKGLYGGYPGSVQMFMVLRKTRLAELFQRSYLPSSWEEIPYETLEILEAKCAVSLDATDVVVMISGGGSGYGDPLERDPDSVRQDVERLLCSDPKDYGVMLREGQVDVTATVALRDSLRQERLLRGRPVTSLDSRKDDRGRHSTLLPCFEVAELEAGPCFLCAKCGYIYGLVSEDPKRKSLVWEMTPEELSPLNQYASNGEPMVIWGFCCPGCGLLIGVQVRRKGDPILFDIQLDMSSASALKASRAV